MLAQSQVGRIEASGNRRPREMVAHDRIRLTGLLRKKPRQRGFFYACRAPATRPAAPRRADFGRVDAASLSTEQREATGPPLGGDPVSNMCELDCGEASAQEQLRRMTSQKYHQTMVASIRATGGTTMLPTPNGGGLKPSNAAGVRVGPKDLLLMRGRIHVRRRLAPRRSRKGDTPSRGRR